MRVVGIILAIFFGLFFFSIAVDWLATGNNYAYQMFWGTRFEDVKRQNYEHTKSYRQGNTQRLNSLCLQMQEADDSHKSMLRDTIQNEFAEWDTDDVPAYLQNCLRTARGN